MTLQEIFSVGGSLSKELPGYIPRDGQLKLVSSIDNAIRNKRHLAADAATGTGKSMAYGLPAAIWAIENDTRVLIVTANIALQDQLVNKDLPIINHILNNRLRFTQLKGRSNYLCNSKMYREGKRDKNKISIIYNEISEWSKHTKTGDKNELNFSYDTKEWSKFTSKPEECPGRLCPSFNQCAIYKARDGANNAHIIVTNYHLLYSDILVYNSTGGENSILPHVDLIIMDEAHEAVGIARDFTGTSLSEANIRKEFLILSDYRALLPDDKLIDFGNLAIDQFARSLANRLAGEKLSRFKQPLGNSFDLIDLLSDASKAFEIVADRITTQRIDIVKEIDDNPDDKKLKYKLDKLNEEIAFIRQHSMICDTYTYKLNEYCNGDSKQKLDGDYVYYLEEDDHDKTVFIKDKLVNVTEFLNKNIFDKTTTIMTSATLAVNGDFSFVIEKQMGLTNYDSVIIDSPFDKKRVLIVIPDPFPEPNRDDEHRAEISKVIHKITTDMGGRVLSLFTSYKNLRHVSEYLRGSLRGFNILVQGSGRSNNKLLEEFKTVDKSVLLGVASLWQGIDVPGKALSCVIIDKIPFIPPSDPILMWMEDYYTKHGQSAFVEYSIPNALITLKQGMGRLIRTVHDYGAIVILDHRLRSKHYKDQFWIMFNDYYKSSNVDDVFKFMYYIENQ